MYFYLITYEYITLFQFCIACHVFLLFLSIESYFHFLLNPGPADKRNIRVATAHIPPVHDKTPSFCDLLVSKKIYILAVSETWLRPHNTAACGVGFLILEHFKVKLHSNPNYSSFESMCANISDSSFSTYFYCTYHPPEHSANFFEEFYQSFRTLYSWLF